MDTDRDSLILSYLPLARAAANQCRQRQFREDIYQACCLRIVEVCTTWDGPEEHRERRIRNDLKHVAWSELGLCLRPFGHPKDYRTAQNLLAVTVEDLDPPQRLREPEVDEDSRDIRQVVKSVIARRPEEEWPLWLELLFKHGVGEGGYDLIAKRHKVALHWVYRELRVVKARLRTALERAGFKAA